jgi:LacI family transcriptional regulator, repressor for deo operon, udp, cdd, tsx, nupC, and nupG
MPVMRRRSRRVERPPLISDVARAAGVSTATVSRALSVPDQVREDTRRRVLETVQALGYTPNAAARHLRAGTSRTVLVVIPRRSNPPFFSEVLHGIDSTLSEAGYAVISGNVGDEEQARRLVDLAHSGRIDGVLATSGLAPVFEGRSILNAGIPVVAIGAEIEGSRSPAVLIDDGACARAQAEHLMALGHRRLLYVAGPEGNYNEVRRFRGFVEAVAQAGLDPEADIVRLPGNYMFSGGVAAAQSFLALAKRPTGVVCCNDEMAIAFAKTVRDAGVAIPGDMSIVGFDGIEFGEFCEPTLTTIQQPRFELGSTGARLLIAAVRDHPGPDSSPIVLHGKLLIRDSTGPARLG